jgi:hypothetical protein
LTQGKTSVFRDARDGCLRFGSGLVAHVVCGAQAEGVAVGRLARVGGLSRTRRREWLPCSLVLAHLQRAGIDAAVSIAGAPGDDDGVVLHRRVEGERGRDGVAHDREGLRRLVRRPVGGGDGGVALEVAGSGEGIDVALSGLVHALLRVGRFGTDRLGEDDAVQPSRGIGQRRRDGEVGSGPSLASSRAVQPQPNPQTSGILMMKGHPGRRRVSGSLYPNYQLAIASG